jgi:hypothetical protein
MARYAYEFSVHRLPDSCHAKQTLHAAVRAADIALSCPPAELRPCHLHSVRAVQRRCAHLSSATMPAGGGHRLHEHVRGEGQPGNRGQESQPGQAGEAGPSGGGGGRGGAPAAVPVRVVHPGPAQHGAAEVGPGDTHASAPTGTMPRQHQRLQSPRGMRLHAGVL